METNNNTIVNHSPLPWHKANLHLFSGTTHIGHTMLIRFDYDTRGRAMLDTANAELRVGDMLEVLKDWVTYLDSDLSEAETVLLERTRAAIIKAETI